MSKSVPLVEVWRGDMIESLHRGHAVICDDSGQIVQAVGDPDAVIYPRSSCKMVQALPLIESGAADAYGLGDEHLALACASHNGAAIHTELVERWLADLELSENDLRCGPQMPTDDDARKGLVCGDAEPCQIHNNCSGKHSGFLTLNRHLGGGTKYIDPEHPVQQSVREAFEEVTGMDSPRFAIDGCSAPNFATSVHGLARAMARFAAPGSDKRGDAMRRLVGAMTRHPELVAGEGRSCTRLMRAMNGVAIKTGAEAVFVAILPEQKLGVALKIEDGGTRASECAIAAILSGLGVLDGESDAARAYCNAEIRNRRDILAGFVRPTEALAQVAKSARA